MNEYVYNSHSHSPTKIASWLLLPHLPDGGVLLNVFLLFLYSLFQAFRCGERCEVKKGMKSRGGPLPLPGFSFFALLFTSQCSPLSERLEQASFCNAQLFINPNPNPETAFFQKKRQTLTPTTRFNDTHLNLCISSCILTPPRFPSPPCFWAFSSLMHYDDVYYFLLHISWCQLQ